MDILYIGPYKQSDGWGKASQDYIRALRLTGHNIITRPIWMSQNYKSTTTEFADLENKVFDSRPNVVIQNVLPFHSDYQYGMKNILQCYYETKPSNHTNWPSKMRLMDQAWVATDYEKTLIGDILPTEVVPMPFDFDELSKHTKPLSIPTITDNDYVFYFIGEVTDRKNIVALIMAYYKAFFRNDSVKLVIKSGLGNEQEYQTYDLISGIISDIQKAMRLYNNPSLYPEIIVMTHTMSFSELCSLHNRGDCLIMPSRGESTSRPVIEAVYFNSNVIATAKTGINPLLCNTVDSREIMASTMSPPIPNIYTSHETWMDISPLVLAQQMKQSYHQRDSETHKAIISNRRQMILDNFSYQAVAKRMNKVLSDN